MRAERNRGLTRCILGDDLMTVQCFNDAITRHDTVIFRYPYMESKEMTECSVLGRRFSLLRGHVLLKFVVLCDNPHAFRM